MRHDIISDVMFVIGNNEKTGKPFCMVPASKLVKSVLDVMQKSGYIGKIEFIDDGKSGRYQVELIGKVNTSSVIKPRFAVGKNEFEKWEKRFLPSKGAGILIVSTPKGIMTHNDAKAMGIGGRLVSYVC